MSTREYRWNCGQYVYHVDGQPTAAPTDSIAIAFDKESGTLHKIGNPINVNRWYQDTVKKLTGGGASDMAADLMVIEGRFPIDEVNKCMDCTGYIGVFYQKLLNGQVQEASFSQFVGTPTSTLLKEVDVLVDDIGHILDEAEASSKKEFLTLQSNLERMQMAMACGEDAAPGFQAELAEVHRKMDASPWTLHPDHGCVLAADVAALDATPSTQQTVGM